NAQHSTGPRTPEGKQVSRFNAMKHGLLAEVVVVDDGFEDATAFHDLRARLRAECQPMGILEEIQVEEAAVAYWRMGRAVGYEAGHLREELDPDPDDEASALDYEKTGEERRTAFEEKSVGVEELASLIEGARGEVSRDGKMSEQILFELFANFGERYP